MATVPLSATLASQHRQIDDGVQGIIDGHGSLDNLAATMDLLRRHLYLEEALLFPPLMKAGLAMPVFVMKREHGQMWPLLTSLSTACAAATPVAELHEPARQLFQLLQIHNTKEEQIVYAAADRLDDAALAAAIGHANAPEGWVCATAPH